MQKPTNRTLHLIGDPIKIVDNRSAAPTGPYDDGDLVAIDADQVGGQSPWGLVQIARKSGTVSLTGPVKLIGKCAGVVVELAVLNGAQAIAPDANLGYQELVFGCGLCESLTILSAGITGGGAYDAFYIPVGERLG